ncbi:MAG TPA: MlaD family protein [Candidatus Binataceae bacterium]
MVEQETPLPPLPESKAVAKKHTRLSPVWIIPVVAALLGVWVAVTRIMSEGPTITIVFPSAEGLEAGKTKIHYKGVDIGTLTKIRLSDDHQRVIATAEMAPKTEGFLVRDTRLWVVRPRISGANVSGLGTLISGAYIGMEIGTSQESKTDFVALDTPPVVTGEFPGRFFVLKTPDLGSLDTGTPIFFRRLQVGQVASYQLDSDGQFFSVKVFVQSPYDHYITENTRFWQASGIDVSLSASGLSVQTQSLLSILIGGIAFATPQTTLAMPAADADTTFTLYDNRSQAFEPPPHNPQTYQLIFNQSVRGLTQGAPVDFRGIKIGRVTEVRAQIDARTFQFSAPVTIELDPQRLGVKFLDVNAGMDFAPLRRKIIDSLVARGVRAQLRSGNLLTGAVFVALDFFPGAPPAVVDWSQTPVQLPTTPGQLETLEASVTNILDKLDKLPLKQISDDVRKTLTDLDLTLATARGTLTNADGTLVSARTTMDSANNFIEPNSVQSQELDNTLQEVTRAARSIRVLADYLERHPDALLRGKPGEAK